MIKNGQRHSCLKTNRLSETVVRREADIDRAAERESTTLRLSKRCNVPMGSGGCSWVVVHVMSALSHWDIANFLVRVSFEERVDLSANGVLLFYTQLCSLVGVICCTLTVSAHESSTGQLPVEMSSEVSLSLSLVVFMLARRMTVFYLAVLQVLTHHCVYGSQA